MTQEFTDYLETDDWKNSAAIVGMIRFFEFAGIPYNRDEIFQADEEYDDDSGYSEGLDRLKFNKSDMDADIIKDKFIAFIEDYFAEDMHHLYVEAALLNKIEWTEEEKADINKKLSANTVMKRCFGKLKFDGTNRAEILEVIRQNRDEMIIETYRYKGYKNFCNENVFQQPGGDAVRLKGYYIDYKRKSRSVSYRYNNKLFQSSDSAYYDFIPFGFVTGRESFFIHDNSSIRQLYLTNQKLQDRCREQAGNSPNGRTDARRNLFESLIYSSDFVDFDVEIIKKDSGKDYFETLYLRRESIDIFKRIKNYSVFCRSIKFGNEWVEIHREVTDAVSNLQLMDDLIQELLKKDVGDNQSNHAILSGNIIRLNALIRSKINGGGDTMNKAMRSACASAVNAAEVLKRRKQTNKISSYRTKLLNALLFHDYDRFSEILLNLSNFTDVYFPFAYYLFEDSEANKDAAYTFVNCFNDYTRKPDEEAESGF